ncbi:hypothetical protein LSH36_375g02071 [Paralvinella palmiformis]|uniref:Uncharacterized protein n=1 Tax=Paralvinella palmiformis TaxID=53620 RepID=A0AAD9JDE2_9ANNE|nr:hypothetical protein LSH36_375g02071 [Paralvinella palmiformis]
MVGVVYCSSWSSGIWKDGVIERIFNEVCTFRVDEALICGWWDCFSADLCPPFLSCAMSLIWRGDGMVRGRGSNQKVDHRHVAAVGRSVSNRSSIAAQLATYRQHGVKLRGSRLSSELEMLIRNILLSPGRISVPWEISMRIRGKRKSSEIIPIMQWLDDEGFGSLVCLQLNVSGRPRRVFIKKRAEEILDRLVQCSISVAEYKQRYELCVQKHEKTYHAAQMVMIQRRGWASSGGEGVVISVD